MGARTPRGRTANSVAVLLGIALLFPASARAERKAVCARECRQGIAACAAWRAPMKRRKAKRICAKELLPVCAKEGTVECERAPHYRGSYTFTGTRTETTCRALPEDFDQGPVSMGLTVHNRARDWIDVTMYWGGTTEGSGVGTTLPWWVKDERGDCLYGAAGGQWCTTGTLTVYGLPPRSPTSPRPPATLAAVLHVDWPEPSECTLTYVGELRYLASE